MPRAVQTGNVVVAALFLAIGISVAGFFVSETIYKSKLALNTAEVKGLAERRVKADLAYWTIGFSVVGSRQSQVAAMYEKAEADQAQIVDLLTSSGLSEEEVKAGIIEYRKQEYRDSSQRLVEEKHRLVGSIEVQTKQVYLVGEVRSKLNKLIAQGFNITNRPPSYHFTELNTIKPEMLKEATKNARVAANEFAANAGVKVGGIRTARQGGFTIRDVGSDYGDKAKIEKDVRVVTNVQFLLDG